MSEHSPGPWKRSVKTWDGTEIQCVEGPEGEVICQEDTDFYAYASGAFVEVEGVGRNMDLIAAAPDLLGCIGTPDRTDCVGCTAIAKAEGRS